MSLRCLALLSASLLLYACGSPGPATQVAVPSGDAQATRAFLHAASTWDADGDGNVTCEEWKAYAARIFAAGDKNGDGVLDAGEYQALGSGDRLFVSVSVSHFDANNDGKLSKQEFVDKPNPAFTYLDVDKNCALSFTELAAGQPKKPRERASSSNEDLFPKEP